MEPANVHIQLRKTEAALLMMLVDSGLLQLSNYQGVSEVVFGLTANAERHKELMEKLFKLQAELGNQIYHKKPSIIVSK